MGIARAGWLMLGCGLVAMSNISAQEPAPVRTVETPAPALPRNIVAAPVFTPVLQHLLAQSPTFRAQSARIAGARLLRVVIDPVMRSRAGCFSSARTTFRRYATGVAIAWVEIPVPLTIIEYGELLGHEFEHILEQLDDVDLGSLAAAGGSATLLADGAYETVRARSVGLAVSRELDTAPEMRDPLLRAIGRASRVLGRLTPVEPDAYAFGPRR